jgi:ATP-binding cassette subfamily F protein uup
MSTVPPGKALLGLQQVSHAYGAQPVLRDVSLTLHEGDRIGLIGRNGCGKSTLLQILSGSIVPDTGLVTRAQGLRVALLRQQSALDLRRTVSEALEHAAAARRQIVDNYHAAMERLAACPAGHPAHDALQTECADLEHRVAMLGGWDVPLEIKRISASLNLPEGGRVLETLSGGELRRVDLAAQLLQHPDVLLLDEPTNHIDTRSVAWIESFLSRYEGTCVLVTHDRYFLDRAVNRIVEIEFMRVYTFPGNYERFLDYKARVEESEATAERSRQNLLRRELAWLRRGAKARSTKQKARIQRYHAVEEEGPPIEHREFMFEIPPPDRLGKFILEARKLTYALEKRTLVDRFTFAMQKDMRVGIIGANGCGKTTLLRLLMGVQEPNSGHVKIGDATQFLYLDQAHEDVHPETTVLDFVSEGAMKWEIGERRVYIPAYLERFFYDRATLHAPVGTLSGGERNRLHLAKQLLLGGNFLVLDEPTNDLDLYTLRILEEMILEFDGCALIVSHDRYFLNRVCTHMLIFEEGGEIVQITGNYDDYLLYAERRAREHRAAQEEARPAPVAGSGRDGDSSGLPAAKRLTYQERRELDAMEGLIVDAEAEVSAREEELNTPGFYEREHTVVNAALAALGAAKSRVEALYARWDELESRR